MSIVQLLETLGAAPNALSAANYAHAVEALGLEDAARDANAISQSLGGRSENRCLVFVPD